MYTKSCLIYTKLGCFLGLSSFVCSLSVLLLFFINIVINLQKPDYNLSRTDIFITSILFCGAMAMELYAVWSMLSTEWAIIVAAFHHNKLVSQLFSTMIELFPYLLTWSSSSSSSEYSVKQFDLLKYWFCYKKKKTKMTILFLRKIIDVGGIVEMWQKYNFTSTIKVPSSFPVILEKYMDNLVQPARGKNALVKLREHYDSLKWSVQELDFDHNILIWHLATSVCYYQMDHRAHGDEEAVKTSKLLSDYMMYLLVMRFGLTLPDQSKSFWLDNAIDTLKNCLLPATNVEAASTQLLEPHIASNEDRLSIRRDVLELVSSLNQLENK